MIAKSKWYKKINDSIEHLKMKKNFCINLILRETGLNQTAYHFSRFLWCPKFLFRSSTISNLKLGKLAQ